MTGREVMSFLQHLANNHSLGHFYSWSMKLSSINGNLWSFFRFHSQRSMCNQIPVVFKREGLCDMGSGSDAELRPGRRGSSCQPTAQLQTLRLSSWSFFFSFSCYLFWEVHPIACRILVPWPEMKCLLPALEVQGLNHWTAWEVALPALSFLHQLTRNDHSPLSQKCDRVLWDNVPDSPLKKPVSKVKNGNLHIFPNVITQTDLAVLYLCICFLILKVCIPFGQVDYNYLLLKWKLYAFFSRSLCSWCIRLLPDTDI